MFEPTFMHVARPPCSTREMRLANQSLAAIILVGTRQGMFFTQAPSILFLVYRSIRRFTDSRPATETVYITSKVAIRGAPVGFLIH